MNELTKTPPAEPGSSAPRWRIEEPRQLNFGWRAWEKALTIVWLLAYRSALDKKGEQPHKVEKA
ncbi:MAG: hypothetical protein NTW26_09710 [bacterium]|nr:hypothetical protein [bacterium]